MSKERFHIKENSIWDRNKGDKRLNLLEICTSLNALDNIADKNVDEYKYIKKLEQSNYFLSDFREFITEDMQKTKEENEKLKQELFEAKRDYLLETADISDKSYLDSELEQLRIDIFGSMIE